MITDKHNRKKLLINGKRIPVWIYGNTKKPLIFFIHGYFRGFSDYVGDLPMRYLSKNYCIVAFDLPGFGYSEKIEMDRVEFINEVIEKVSHNRPFFLFGISYGGLLSLKVARDNKKVKAVILGGTPYLFGINKVIPSLLLPYLKNFRLLSVAKEFGFLNKKSLSTVSVPVLLLYSSSDWKANSLMARMIKRLLPNAKLYVTKGLSHSWLMHRIDRSGFLNEIETFLSDSF